MTEVESKGEGIGESHYSCFFFFLLLSIPITEKIEEIYKAFIKESGIQFNELEGQVLQFHLSNLEYACGSNLHQVRLSFVKGVL